MKMAHHLSICSETMQTMGTNESYRLLVFIEVGNKYINKTKKTLAELLQNVMRTVASINQDPQGQVTNTNLYVFVPTPLCMFFHIEKSVEKSINKKLYWLNFEQIEFQKNINNYKISIVKLLQLSIPPVWSESKVSQIVPKVETLPVLAQVAFRVRTAVLSSYSQWKCLQIHHRFPQLS